jgi:hypothetical protein
MVRLALAPVHVGFRREVNDQPRPNLSHDRHHLVMVSDIHPMDTRLFLKIGSK